MRRAHPRARRPSTRAGSPLSSIEPSRPVTPAQIEAALERVVQSATFRRSQRHREFLSHVVRAALADEQDQLKEVIIGLEVFRRSIASYDPRSDPIVRVEAGRLRDKLLRFYDDEGANEAFEITIPVGSYVPRFAPRVDRTSRRSIAILPFANLSGHLDDRTFSIGLADQLIDTLGRVTALKVVARVSALEAGERELPLTKVGKLLGVDHVVEGSVQRSGSRIRCIARFSRVKDGLQLWSQRFEEQDASSADLFDFQDRIADTVVEAVTRSFEAAGAARRPQAPLARAPSTQNAEARELFERARYLSQQGSIDGYERAIALLERAVLLEPLFAQAHSHLGGARAYLASYVFAPPIPAFAKVKEAALRALALDPLDGEAHALLAVISHRIEADWTTAEPKFVEALRIAPNSTLVHTQYSWGLVFNGRFAEATRHARIALDLDPLNITQRAHNARLYSYAGDNETALRELDAVLALDPGHFYARLVIGIIHLSIGDIDRAITLFERIAAERPGHSAAHLHRVCAYGLRGETDRGRRELASWSSLHPDQPHSAFYLALASACLGDRRDMLEQLERAARARDYLFVSTPAHVLFDRYRDDADFVALLNRHGLALIDR